jgi:hypothetical protein
MYERNKIVFLHKQTDEEKKEDDKKREEIKRLNNETKEYKPVLIPFNLTELKK